MYTLSRSVERIKQRLAESTNPKEKAHLNDALRFLTIAIGFINDADTEIRQETAMDTEDSDDSILIIENPNKPNVLDMSLDELMRTYQDYAELQVSRYLDNDEGYDIDDGDFPFSWVILNKDEKKLAILSQLDKYWAECPYELKNPTARQQHRDKNQMYNVNNLVLYSVYILSQTNHQHPTSDDVIDFMIKTFPVHIVPDYINNYMMAETMLPDGLLAYSRSTNSQFQRYKLAREAPKYIQTLIEKFPRLGEARPTST